MENIELEKSEEIKPKIVEEESSSIDISKKKSIEEKTKEIEEKIRLAKEKKRNSKKLTQ